MKWSIQERGGVLYSSIEPHIEAVGKRIKGSELYFPKRMFIALQKDRIYWVYGVPEFGQMARLWIKRWLGDKKKRFIKTAHARYVRSRDALLPLMEAELPPTSKALLDLMPKVRAIAVEHTRTVAVSIDGFDDYFLSMFSDWIQKHGYEKLVADEKSWSILTAPAWPSAGMEYRHELILGLLKKKPIDAIADHCHKKFVWLTLGWGRAAATKKNVVRDLRKLQKLTRRELVNEETALKKYVRRIKKERARVIKKYRIPLRIVRPYLQLLDECARLHDERKEIQVRTVYVLNRIQKFIAGKNTFSPAQEEALSWMTEAELACVIRTGTFPKKSLTNRMQAVCFRIGEGAMKRDEGKNAVKLINTMLSEARETSSGKEVTGTRASLGIACGRAIVTASVQEAIHQIRKGDILITTMTTPDFVPAMKKAAAIVTDQGGITSHAALISREMGIPCVIGTISATQVFKTGDTVEVDANSGIVRLK